MVWTNSRNNVVLKTGSSKSRVKLETDADHELTLADNTRHDFRGSSLTDIVLPFASRKDFPVVGSQRYLYLDKETGDMFTYGYVDQDYTSVGLSAWDIVGGGGSTQKGEQDAETDPVESTDTD